LNLNYDIIIKFIKARWIIKREGLLFFNLSHLIIKKSNDELIF